MTKGGRRLFCVWCAVCAVSALTPVQSVYAQADTSTGVGSQFELVFWQSVSASDDQQQLSAYLERYPTGTFASLARAKLAALARRGGGAAVTEQPTVAAPAVSAPVGLAPAAPAPVATVSGGPATAVAARMVIPAEPSPLPKPDVTDGGSASAAATSPPAELTLAQQLRALSQSQGLRPTVVISTVTPTPPSLAPVPEVLLPGRFCSAEERNSFHDNSYLPAVEVATANNRVAIGHLEALRGLYDQAVAQGDGPVANAVADASKAYAGTAKTAYDQRAAFDVMFKGLMAVPILDCGARK